MKIILSRTIHMEKSAHQATIGVPEKDKIIYLGFLRHVEETKDPSAATINSTMLNLIPRNSRGELIIKKLIEDKLLTYVDGALALTQVGDAALNAGVMITPHPMKYIFTIINDVLVPQHIFNYAPFNQDNESEADGASEDGKKWLKEPYYPAYPEKDGPKETMPRTYSLLGRKNETLYLYSICQEGQKLKASDSETKCTITLSIPVDSIPTVELKTKSVEIAINSTCVKTWNNFQIYSNLHLGRFDIDYNPELDSLAIDKDFRSLTDEELRSGYAEVNSKKAMDVSEYGTFDSIVISDIEIIVSTKEDLIQWALFRIFDAINYYITDTEYQKIRHASSIWCSKHTSSTLSISSKELEELLPDYNAMVSFLINRKQELTKEELTMKKYINRILETKSYRRWYIQAPYQLTFPYGGEKE